MWFFKKKTKVKEIKKVYKIEEYEKTVNVGKLLLDIELENGHTIRRTFEGCAYFKKNNKEMVKEYGWSYGRVEIIRVERTFETLLKELEGTIDKGWHAYSPKVLINGGYYDGYNTYHFNTKVKTLTKRIEKHEVKVMCEREVEV